MSMIVAIPLTNEQKAHQDKRLLKEDVQARRTYRPNHMLLSGEMGLHFLDVLAERASLARRHLFLPWMMIPTTDFLLHPPLHVLQQPLLLSLIPRAVARLTHIGQ